jgi:hypothetical protein
LKDAIKNRFSKKKSPLGESHASDDQKFGAPTLKMLYPELFKEMEKE